MVRLASRINEKKNNNLCFHVHIELYLFHLQPCYCQSSIHPPRPIQVDSQTLLDFGPFPHSTQHSARLGEMVKAYIYLTFTNTMFSNNICH